MNPRRTVRSFLLLASLAFACHDTTSVQVTEADLIGRWVPDARSSQWIGEVADQSACHLELESGGALRGVAPRYMLGGKSWGTGQVVPVAGTWLLSRSTGGPTVDLTTRTPDEPGTLLLGSLLVDRDSDGVVLYFPIGDPDSLQKFGFRRTAGR